jgi:hypothetical protein
MKWPKVGGPNDPWSENMTLFFDDDDDNEVFLRLVFGILYICMLLYFL